MIKPCMCGEPIAASDPQTECSRCSRILHAECALGHGEHEYCEACAPSIAKRRIA